jgi:hypothetical protein
MLIKYNDQKELYGGKCNHITHTILIAKKFVVFGALVCSTIHK